MANTKISALPAAGTLTGAELLATVKAGVTSKSTVTEVLAAIPNGTFAKPAVAGTLAGRPTATVIGQRYLATDTNGGTEYESLDGSTWTQMTVGLTASVPISGAGLGGATASDQLLKDWTTAEAYEVTAATRDANDVVTTATVKWPDGSAGTFTTVTANATFLTIDAYTVSHTSSGKTVTQAAVTRNANGAVTVKPALTVA